MPQKIVIYNTEITIPDSPLLSEIEDWGMPKEEQYWRKKKLPEIFSTIKRDEAGNIELTKEQEAFCQREFDRIKNGFWFMNNGEPTYITGRNYYYLQYWTLENRKAPEYRETTRRYYLYLEHWYNVYWCLGIVRGKSRRSGASSESSANIVSHVTTTKNARGGHVSKTSADARKMFIYRMQFGFRHLPFFLQPTLANDKDSKTELVFNVPLSKSKKKKAQLIDEVEGLNSILDYQPTATNSYDSERLTWFFGDECFAKDTKILCDNFEFKNIQDIKPGEWVIVEGGKKVQVHSICSGFDNMYIVKQPHSKDYIVNSSHRLYLEQRNDKFEKSEKNKHKNGFKKLTVKEYFELDNYSKRTIYGVRSNGLEFEEKEVLIDPYILGVWIGDGFSNDSRFIVNIKEDVEILNEIINFAQKNDYRTRISRCHNSEKCRIVSISNSNNKWKKNDFTENLKTLGIFSEKRIPKEYLINSKKIRLALLAGIIDTDGFMPKNGVFEICMSRFDLINDISNLAKSCGLSVSNIKEKNTNFKTNSYRIAISGDISEIPTRLKRKAANDYVKKYAHRRNKIEINSIGVGQYFGITLKTENDDDRRLILEDFTLSMNCGKYPADVPVSQFISIILETLVEGSEKVGFCELPSTVNELTKKGGAEFKLIWDDADWKIEDDEQEIDKEEEATANRLVRYFCPAYDGLSGFIGKYGESIIDEPTEEQARYLIEKYGEKKFSGQLKMGAKAYLEKRRSKLNGMALEEEIRKYPFNEVEMFMAANTECVFNMMKIVEREEQLKENRVYKRNVIFYRDMDQKVRWRDINENEKHFHWKITWFPNENDTNKKKIDRIVRPARTHDGAIAVDSYSNSQGGRKYGSKASAWIGRRYDFTDSQNSGKAIGHLYGRPLVKDTLHEQVMLASEYYGYQVWYEHTADDYEGYFRERGKIGYLGKYPMSLIPPEKRATADRHRGTPITPFSLTRQLDNGIAYIENHCNLIDFEEILQYAKVFDPYDRTKYDCIVSWLMLISLLMEPASTPQIQNKREAIIKVYS